MTPPWVCRYAIDCSVAGPAVPSCVPGTRAALRPALRDQPQSLADRADDRIGGGEERVLERRAVRDRRLRGRDRPGIVEIVEASLGEKSEDPGRPTARSGSLLHGEHAIRLRYRGH